MTRNPACAICGHDERAVALTKWDGRDVLACSSCTAPVVAVETVTTMRERVFAFVRRQPGCTFAEMSEAFGIFHCEREDDPEGRREYDNLLQVVLRAAKSGYLIATGKPAQYAIGVVPPPRQEAKPKRKRKTKWKKRTPEQKANHLLAERRRRVRAKEMGLCISCGTRMDPEWTTVRCPECNERNNASSQRFRVTPAGRKVDRSYAKRRYWRDVESARARRRRIYLEKKAKGECSDCTQPCAEDSLLCAEHRDRKNRVMVEYRRKKREMRRAA